MSGPLAASVDESTVDQHCQLAEILDLDTAAALGLAAPSTRSTRPAGHRRNGLETALGGSDALPQVHMERHLRLTRPYGERTMANLGPQRDP